MSQTTSSSVSKQRALSAAFQPVCSYLATLSEITQLESENSVLNGGKNFFLERCHTAWDTCNGFCWARRRCWCLCGRRCSTGCATTGAGCFFSAQSRHVQHDGDVSARANLAGKSYPSPHLQIHHPGRPGRQTPHLHLHGQPPNKHQKQATPNTAPWTLIIMCFQLASV